MSMSVNAQSVPPVSASVKVPEPMMPVPRRNFNHRPTVCFRVRSLYNSSVLAAHHRSDPSSLLPRPSWPRKEDRRSPRFPSKPFEGTLHFLPMRTRIRIRHNDNTFRPFLRESCRPFILLSPVSSSFQTSTVAFILHPGILIPPYFYRSFSSTSVESLGGPCYWPIVLLSCWSCVDAPPANKFVSALKSTCPRPEPCPPLHPPKSTSSI